MRIGMVETELPSISIFPVPGGESSRVAREPKVYFQSRYLFRFYRYTPLTTLFTGGVPAYLLVVENYEQILLDRPSVIIVSLNSYGIRGARKREEETIQRLSNISNNSYSSDCRRFNNIGQKL